ncbi:uncharacterized protein LOC120006389 [Tripterygium wilfordii]|uniref:uncharacterized protein LOC120006389 n=1 Tax=Tripterygium wilfordii TaxID=458696 RepID=UPI0018F817E8|nr:uncharacterized protein LOC120006389 [Tripterygium wilfordii]
MALKKDKVSRIDRAKKQPLRSSSRKRTLESIRRASLKRRGLEMAENSARRASSVSLTHEEIMASLTLLEAEMAERKPQRGSSKRKILKKRWIVLKRLKRGAAELRASMRSEAENREKEMEAEYREKEMDRERVKKEVMRAFDEWLATALDALETNSSEEIPEAVFAGQLKM